MSSSGANASMRRPGQRCSHTGSSVLMDKLLTAQLKTYETQVDNGALSPSTYVGYRKALTGKRMAFWRTFTLGEASTPKLLRDWISELWMTATREPIALGKRFRRSERRCGSR